MRVVKSFIIFLIFSNLLSGQTCCSGGVPVSSNLGFQSSESGVLQTSLSVDFNYLRTLKSGTERLNDDQRMRSTQSFIFRSAYTFNNRISIEGFLPAVRQTRKITTLSGSDDIERTFGIGDPVLLFLYKLVDKDIQLRIGAGPQIPLGSFNQTNRRGLILLEDLQPGSGAWDAIFMGTLEYPISQRLSSLIFINSIISRTGTNDKSRGGAQSYKFGNDIQIITGYADQVLLFNQVLNPGLSFRYRHAQHDRVNNLQIPGTGGSFLFTRFSLGIPFLKWESSFNVNVEFPIWSRVNDTQLAPSIIINAGWFKTFDFSKKVDPLINLERGQF